MRLKARLNSSDYNENEMKKNVYVKKQIQFIIFIAMEHAHKMSSGSLTSSCH